MQCDGQLYHAKSRAEMATGSRHCFYEPPTHLHGQLWQLAFGQCLHIARSADRGNQVPASVANRGVIAREPVWEGRIAPSRSLSSVPPR